MNGLRAYRHYHALKKHFSNNDYSAIKDPLVMIAESAFLKRNDRYLWEKLAESMTSTELLHYMVANFVYGNPNFLYDAAAAEANFKTWIRKRDSILYLFETEISELTDGAPEEILSRFMAGKMSIETVAILSNYNDYLKIWEDNASAIFQSEIFRIKKARCFIKFNKEKVEGILKNSGILNEKGCGSLREEAKEGQAQ